MRTKVGSLAYYGLRILQRLALLAVGLYTILVWIVMINIVFTTTVAQQTVNHEWRNAQALQDTTTKTINTLSVYAGVAAANAAALTLAMLIFPRVRRNEKRLVVDGLVIAAFCFLSVATSQFAVQQFTTQYLIGI